MTTLSDRKIIALGKYSMKLQDDYQRGKIGKLKAACLLKNKLVKAGMPLSEAMPLALAFGKDLAIFD